MAATTQASTMADKIAMFRNELAWNHPAAESAIQLMLLAISPAKIKAAIATQRAARRVKRAGLPGTAKEFRKRLMQCILDPEKDSELPNIQCIKYCADALPDLRPLGKVYPSGSGNGEIYLCFRLKNDGNACLKPCADGTATYYLLARDPDGNTEDIEHEQETLAEAAQSLLKRTEAHRYA